jgi:hypothetical protein
MEEVGCRGLSADRLIESSHTLAWVSGTCPHCTNQTTSHIYQYNHTAPAASPLVPPLSV